MLATALAGNQVSLELRRFIQRLVPVGAVLLAVLFILRGLSLGKEHELKTQEPKPQITQIKRKNLSLSCPKGHAGLLWRILQG